MKLMEMLSELPAIAERADRERLSCLWPEFEKECPDLAAEMKYCASIEDPQTVLKYLNERIPMLNVIRLTTPRFDQILIFIHQFMREKQTERKSTNDRRTDQDRDRKHLRARRAKRTDI